MKRIIKLIIPHSVFLILKNIYLSGAFIPVFIKKAFGFRYLVLRMDTTNTCNLRCKYCYTLLWHHDKPKVMTSSEFKMLADSLFRRTKFLALSCAYEPLLNNEFHELIGIASKYKIPKLFFVTNGQLLSDKVILASIKAPVHEIAFSIDAASKTMYEEIRTNASFEKIISNLKKVHEYKEKYNSKYPLISINFTIFKQNAQEAPDFILKYHKYFDLINITHLLTRVRNDINPYERLDLACFNDIIKKCRQIIQGKQVILNYSFSPVNKPLILCCNSISYLSVAVNGDVFFCNKKKVGNIFEKPLKDIENSNSCLMRKMYFANDDYCRSSCGS